MSSNEPPAEAPPVPVDETQPRMKPTPTAQARLPLSRLVLGGILVAGGGLWLLGVLDVVDVSISTALSVALIVVGLALVAGSRTGRHSGLMTIGIILTVVLAIASSLNIKIEGGVGERTERPASLSDVKGKYRLGVGQLTIDLRGLSFPFGSTTRIQASVGIGQLVVEVGGSAGNVEAHGKAGLGDVMLFDKEGSGFDVDLTQQRVQLGPSPPEGFAVLILELSVGLGQVTVDGE